MKSISLIALVLSSLCSFAQFASEGKEPATKMKPMTTIVHQDVESTNKSNLVEEKLVPSQVSHQKLDIRNQDQALMKRKKKGPGEIEKHLPVK